MSCPLPHFVLFSPAGSRSDRESGRWSFRLERHDGSPRLNAADREPCIRGQRLELLAVVRGLEALDEPSTVTLVTDSDYVVRGLNNGLDEWRSNGWTWEAFGEMVPIKNRDLWQRIDRAMTYHQVNVRRTGRKSSGGAVPAPHFPLPTAARSSRDRPSRRAQLNAVSGHMGDRFARFLARLIGRLRAAVPGWSGC